jgi:hypothetical protein
VTKVTKVTTHDYTPLKTVTSGDNKTVSILIPIERHQRHHVTHTRLLFAGYRVAWALVHGSINVGVPEMVV